eukprot:gnl/Spiro4/3536_TR1731_c1_g8_i2.p2 gnl/Spiro4/3536_TR1731_c1_g8~~gnl/Spiro4/3536_TR1731_c1_g8_i2.p2  ORF type:complete len:180 (-),score=16.39 gnl/Spiro4/3536_TR1731_c1_g8_i2:129-668(-)
MNQPQRLNDSCRKLCCSVPVSRDLEGKMWRVLFMTFSSRRFGVVRDEATFVRTIGCHGLASHPANVCVDHDNNLIVAGRGDHRIQVLCRDGTFVRSFGSFGTAQGQFNMPHGVCVNAAGHIIVADTWNDRVQIFANDGTFLRVFGSEGASDGQFSRPFSVCADADDNIVVSDYCNCRKL